MKKNGKTIYLGGNIGAFSGKEVKARFTKAKKELEALGYRVLSPLRGKNMTCKKHVDANCYQFEPNEIVGRDLNDIKQADLMVAIQDKPSIGTSMEICFSRAVKNIPVIVVTMNNKVANHYWIRFFATKVCRSLDEAIKHIKQWAYYE